MNGEKFKKPGIFFPGLLAIRVHQGIETKFLFMAKTRRQRSIEHRKAVPGQAVKYLEDGEAFKKVNTKDGKN